MSEDGDTPEGEHGGGDPGASLPLSPPTVGIPAGAMWPNPEPDVEAEPTYPELIPPVLPQPILLIMPQRAKQRRWTVLLRFFLALPLSLVLLFVGIAVFVCVFLGWFFAIVMGRAPVFVRSIMTIYIRMLLRLYSYTFLLTDRFPPFDSGEVPGYGIRLAVPPATKLNRAAVLFRIILVVPASILAQLVGLGLQVVSIFMWFTVLITGWLPKSVHEVYEAYIRYEMRVLGYFYLLVPTYPGELFGDLDDPPALPEATSGPALPDAMPSDLVPPSPATPQSTPLQVAPLQDAVSQPAPPPPAAPRLTPRQPWMLILSMGAKRLLVVVIVLGLAAAAGLVYFNVTAQRHANLVEVNNELVTNLDNFTATAGKCGSVSCLEQADGALSEQLGSFVSDLESSDSDGISKSIIDQMTMAARNAQRVTATLSEAGPTASGYRDLATKLDAEQVFTQLSSAQHAFVQAVNAGRFG